MIRDFIGDKIVSGVLFDGTYGIEIETESLESYRTPRMSLNEDGDQIIGRDGQPVSDMSFWDVKKDGSLRNFGLEYILKVPLKYEDELLQALVEFENKTQHIQFIQDSISTSVHIHVNALPETWKTLANFLTIYVLVENILIEYSGEFRRNNLFCLPIRSVPSVHSTIIQMFQKVFNQDYKFKYLLNPDQIKYAALNLACLYRFGSVEFRSFRGVTDIETIYSWVTMIHKMLEYARGNFTPVYILDCYKHKGDKVFEEVFGDYWKLLKHDKQEELLKPNLWYAGNIAYSLNDEQWNELDNPVRKKEKKKTAKKSIEEVLHEMANTPMAFVDTPQPEMPPPTGTWASMQFQSDNDMSWLDGPSPEEEPE